MIIEIYDEQDQLITKLPDASGPVPRFGDILRLPEEEKRLNLSHGFTVIGVSYDLENDYSIATVDCTPFLGEYSAPELIEELSNILPICSAKQ